LSDDESCVKFITHWWCDACTLYTAWLCLKQSIVCRFVSVTVVLGGVRKSLCGHWNVFWWLMHSAPVRGNCSRPL